MSISKNDLAWEKLFVQYRILDKVKTEGVFVITATQINEHREARLMTKFDHRSQLPRLFADNGLSILPTSRGGYLIGQFETFCAFNRDEVEVTHIDFPTNLESLDFREITSEATAINCAYVSGILQDFTGEKTLMPTVSGRMSSSSFGFDIKMPLGDLQVQVDKAQVEIDGGYEGAEALYLIEAKNYLSDDFLVRQLFYPFKLWSGKLRKPIRTIFLTYSNGIFHLREYAFANPEHYNSLELLRHSKYAVQEGRFGWDQVLEILNQTAPVEEPPIPFPQADSFDRVVNLCELLHQKGFMSKEEITENYDFDARQTDYYANAGKYLGLVEFRKDPDSGQKGCYLTPKGEEVFNLHLVERQREFVRLMLSHRVFEKTLRLYLEKGEMPAKAAIVEQMKASGLHKVEAETTYFRRASTVTGWIAWLVRLVEI